MSSSSPSSTSPTTDAGSAAPEREEPTFFTSAADIAAEFATLIETLASAARLQVCVFQN